MAFQICKDNIPLTLGNIDEISAEFFGVEITDTYVAPKDYPWYCNWFEMVGHAIDKLPKGQHEWPDVIGNICRVAATLADKYEDFESSLNIFKPFIELCLHFKSLGLIPVSVD